MKIDYADDPMLSNHLKQLKSNLINYFHDNYADAAVSTPPLTPSPSSVQSLPTLGSPQKSFTAWYCKKEKPSVNELKEYFKLPTEDFDAKGWNNDLIHWVGR
jgi:hypothetical protein